jgi:MiaB-like tRNA modifying enzyme
LKVYFETYGCALNHADTAMMKSVLASRGYRLVDTIDDADVIVVNTCTVRLDTEERMKRRIAELYQLAAKKGALLVVAGCMAAAQPFTVKRVAPSAILVSPQNVHRVFEAIEESRDLLDEPPTPKTLFVPREGLIARGRVAEVPVVDGCLGDCSFCITKLARRRVDSRPLDKVVSLVRRLVERGVVEVRLTGQDIAVYGVDLAGRRMLPDLIAAVAEIPGDFMVRVGMMSPDQLLPILDEVLEAMKHPKVYKFLHIPIQSGDDRVLKIMRRRYTVDDVRVIVKEARRKLAGVTIATDIIVGHPGEDEEAFQNTVRVVEELRFERVHVAQYTPRPRTPAAAMKQIPDPIKKSRSKRLMAVVERVGLEEHRRLVGSRARVLVVGPGERGGYESRLYNYVQVILPKTPCTGCWVDVEITSATWYDVRGAPLACEG